MEGNYVTKHCCDKIAIDYLMKLFINMYFFTHRKHFHSANPVKKKMLPWANFPGKDRCKWRGAGQAGYRNKSLSICNLHESPHGLEYPRQTKHTAQTHMQKFIIFHQLKAAGTYHKSGAVIISQLITIKKAIVGVFFFLKMTPLLPVFSYKIVWSIEILKSKIFANTSLA